MIRTLSALALLFAVGCNPPEARDNSVSFFDLQPAVAGWANLHEVRATVDADVREMDVTLDYTLSGIFSEAAIPTVELDVLEGLTTAGSDVLTADDSATVRLTPNFRSCDGPTYFIREDGGCEYDTVAISFGDGPYTLSLGVRLRAHAADDWTGNPDDLNVAVSVIVAQ